MGNFWLIWTVSFNKIKCKWSNISSISSAIAGDGVWISSDNEQFCIFKYHSDAMNDESEPAIPGFIGYPDGIPDASYCPLYYRVWRSVQTSMVSSKPFITNIIEDQGDDYWKQTSPFEWEAVESKPVTVSQCPQSPSDYNSVLDVTDQNNMYRTYYSEWFCDGENINYVQGPIYDGSVESQGTGEWNFTDKARTDPLIGIVYRVDWVANESGLGVVPKHTLSEDALRDLSMICESNLDYTVTEEGNVDKIGYPLVGEVDENGDPIQHVMDKHIYPYYRVEYNISNWKEDNPLVVPTYRSTYNCDTDVISDPEIIELSEYVEGDTLRTDIWSYIDSYTQDGSVNCVYYFHSSESSRDISKFQAPNKTVIDTVGTCSCSVIPSLFAPSDLMSVSIANVIGDPARVNGKYDLNFIDVDDSSYDVTKMKWYYNSLDGSTVEEEDIESIESIESIGSIGSSTSSDSSSFSGTLPDELPVEDDSIITYPNIEISLSYDVNIKVFDLVVKYYYSQGSLLTINDVIHFPEYFISSTVSVATVPMIYNYGSTSGTCAIGLHGIPSNIVE
jgi:hypothetical protein